MLTKESIKENQTLSNLSDEQIETVITIANNLANSEASKATKKAYDNIDQIVLEVAGIEKPRESFTSDHYKNILMDFSKKAESGKKASQLQIQIEQLTSEKAELEKKIKEGATDGLLKQQVDQLTQKLRDSEQKSLRLSESMEKEKKSLTDELLSLKQQKTFMELNRHFDRVDADPNIKFNPSIPANLLKETLELRKSKILNNGEYKVDWVENGDGKQKMVFRDSQGELLRNPKNAYEPFTPSELYFSKIEDLLDKGIQKQGAGLPPQGGGGKGLPLSLSGVRDQIHADELIQKHILTVEGILKTDPQFGQRHKELRQELKVQELPIQAAPQ